MEKKFVFAIFLIVIALASTIVAVYADDSTVTLTVNTNQNNPTEFPYDAYSHVTLTDTMAYNDIASITYPSDGLVGLQIQDANDQTIVIRTLATGTTIPYGLNASISQAYLCSGESQISSISIPSASNPGIPTFYFTLFNNLNTIKSYLVTLNVYDSNGVPIAVAYQPVSPAGQSSAEAIVDFNIPSWAHYGTAYAYVDVYNTWPSQGGVPQGEEKSFQFTITGGTPFQGTPSTTVSLNGVSQYFDVTFRLPQSCALGNYTAYQTTNYLGSYSASQTTPFTVKQLADISGDGIVNFNDITAFVGLYIAYFDNGVYSPQIDFLHTGTINFNDVILFVGYYIQAWSS